MKTTNILFTLSQRLSRKSVVSKSKHLLYTLRSRYLNERPSSVEHVHSSQVLKIEEAVDTNTEPYADESGRQVGLVTVVKVPSWTVTALFGAVCALLLVVLMVYCGVHVLDTPVTTEQQHQTSECKNAPCSDFAAMLRASMSPAVRPCDDFYGHVCGSWNAKRAVRMPFLLTMKLRQFTQNRTGYGFCVEMHYGGGKNIPFVFGERGSRMRFNRSLSSATFPRNWKSTN